MTARLSVGYDLESSSSDWPDLHVMQLAVTFCRGTMRLSAQGFRESGWRELVAAGFLQSSFISWARKQYSVMITEKGAAVVMSDVARAASVAVEYNLPDVSEFFIACMASGDLPEFLSHEVVTIREAAAARLEELTNSSCEEK